MRVLKANNVNDALLLGLSHLYEEGVERPSRNGPVLVFPHPVTTEYENPTERVIFFPERDANPYFHLMEALWMFAGRRDVAWISQFSGNIANFSDDGVTFHGAYGHRWRGWFEDNSNYGNLNYGDTRVDQLETIANLLKQNPDDRRVVLQMWDARADLGMIGKDFPCNLIATFRINPYGSLDLNVFNRSNDMIWGAYGANAVHFSVLQELMAAWIGVPVGKYWQISTNFHAYKDVLEKHGAVANNAPGFDYYAIGKVHPMPMVNVPMDVWMQDLMMFMDQGPVIGFRDPFFKKVVTPMWKSWFHWKNKEDPDHMQKAMDCAHDIIASDWALACMEWLERRA